MNPKSKKPGKQRLYGYHMALHLAQKRLAVHLSKELKKEFKKTALPVRKDDTVKIVRGGFKGKTGKIIGVNYKKGTVTIEKIMRKKTDGKEVLVPVQASNLIMTAVEQKDEARFGKKPSKKTAPKETKKEEKPIAKAETKKAEEKPSPKTTHTPAKTEHAHPTPKKEAVSETKKAPTAKKELSDFKDANSEIIRPKKAGAKK